jgi:hypothetical protein
VGSDTATLPAPPRSGRVGGGAAAVRPASHTNSAAAAAAAGEAEEDGADFERRPGTRRRGGTVRVEEEEDDSVAEAAWERVEQAAADVEDVVVSTEELMRENTRDRMSDVRKRRAAITRLVREARARARVTEWRVRRCLLS